MFCCFCGEIRFVDSEVLSIVVRRVEEVEDAGGEGTLNCVGGVAFFLLLLGRTLCLSIGVF